MFDRRTRAPLRPRPELGGESPGVGRGSARIGAAVGEGRQDRRANRHALPGAGGAHQRGPLPAHGRCFRRTIVDLARGRRVLPSLATCQHRGARTPAVGAEVIPQNAGAAPHARQRAKPDRRHCPTSAPSVGRAAGEPHCRPAQDSTRHRTVDRTATTNRGDREHPC